MAHMVKVDHDAFNRGVDHALTLKPVRTAVSHFIVVMTGTANKASPKVQGGSNDKRRAPAKSQKR